MSQRSSIGGIANLDELKKWIQDFYANPDVVVSPLRDAQAERMKEIQRISMALHRNEEPNQSDGAMGTASNGACGGEDTLPTLRERDGVAKTAALDQQLQKSVLSFEDLQKTQKSLLIQVDDAKVVRGYENLQQLIETKSQMEKHHMNGKGLVNALRRLDIEILRESNETLDDTIAAMLDQRSKHLEKKKNKAAPAPYQPDDISSMFIRLGQLRLLNRMRDTTAKMLVQLNVHLKKNVEVLQLIRELCDGRSDAISRGQEPK